MDTESALRPRFVVDEEGRPVSVLLDYDQFQRMLDDLEELEDIRTFDGAKQEGGTPIPAKAAFEEIEYLIHLN